MIFEIHAERSATDKKIFFYDNETNTLQSEGNIYQFPEDKRQKFTSEPVVPFDKDTPLKKSKLIKRLKIQMGLSCNYACDYCSQKFIERPPETSKKDIDDFMAKINSLEFSEEQGLHIEFWGGEPFVYWKTMKPLAETLKEKFASWKKKPLFSVITNGSILTREICAWLMYMGFSVSISHDGPGQYVRGPDPFDDPEQKKIILEFYEIMRPLGRISFNPMLNAKNRSRKEIHEWFVNLTGDPTVIHGEGGIVDAYDEDGAGLSLNTKQEHFDYRQLSFNDMYVTDGVQNALNFTIVSSKINAFTQDVMSHKNSNIVPQKCGMDQEDIIAIDMKGNVITCQNVSAAQISHNGESHLGGNITDIEDVEIKTATHWMKREECPKCPILHLCKGACMFLSGKFWGISCSNAYSDNIPIFAMAFSKMTNGYIPYYINNNELPPERRDIWGTILDHKDEPKKKVIPIKIVAEKKVVVDDIEVYEKSRIETVEVDNANL